MNDQRITYRQQKDAKDRSVWEVSLNGNFVGEIRHLGFERFQYFPKGQKTGREIFRSLPACQKSLEY